MGRYEDDGQLSVVKYATRTVNHALHCLITATILQDILAVDVRSSRYILERPDCLYDPRESEN